MFKDAVVLFAGSDIRVIVDKLVEVYLHMFYHKELGDALEA